MRAARLSRGRRAALAAGVMVTALAVAGPMHHVAHHSLTGHMVQHMLLVMVAAPLLAVGAPGVLIPPLLPTAPRRAAQGVRRRALAAGRLLPAPLLAAAAVAVHAGVLWTWHAPGPYDAAVRSTPLHMLEHLTLLVTAVAAWAAAVGGLRIVPSVGPLLVLFAIALQCALLGAAMAFSDRPWYSVHAVGAEALDDQRMAGLIMWGAGGVTPVIAAGALVAAWLDRRDPARA